MEPVPTLPYAAKPRRWTWRRGILLALTLALIGAAFLVYGEIRRRMDILKTCRPCGTIDWGKVLSSPPLLRLAWQLSSDPFLEYQFARRPDAVAGLSLFGADEENVEVELELPLRYVDGQLQIEIVITNRSDSVILIPLFDRAGVHRRVGSSGGPEPMIWCDARGGWLSSDTYLLTPKRTFRTCVTAIFEEKPCDAQISLMSERGLVVDFRIRPDGLGIEPIKLRPARWEDVPPSSVLRFDHRSRTATTLGERTLSPPIRRVPAPDWLKLVPTGEDWPDAMLTPDEREPKPWEKLPPPFGDG